MVIGDLGVETESRFIIVILIKIFLGAGIGQWV
jgi:hypothetical protein